MSAKENIPSQIDHIAIIMDGNNRWAKQQGLKGIAGHKAGVERIRDMLEACKEHNIGVVTLFAFSSENWQRPPMEVKALMSLFYEYLKRESKKMQREGVRLKVIGRRDRFEPRLIKTIEQAEATTQEGERTLVIAADYGGKWDMVNAATRLAESIRAGNLSSDEVDEQRFNEFTSMADFPPVDCLVRTGGEYRISNFLLWQAAYAELYFSDLLWPDFDREAVNAVVADFQTRQRRFGKKSEQLETKGIVSMARQKLAGNNNA